jgi:CCR4-Not complex component, Not1
MNCIKHPDRSDFEVIKKSFFISGYRNDIHINRMLLDSFVLYVPYWLYSQNTDSNDPAGAMENYKKESYTLFIRLLKDSNYEFRDALMSSILNNLRFPNPITFYFLNLILTIFGEVDSDKIHEQLVR